MAPGLNHKPQYLGKDTHHGQPRNGNEETPRCAEAAGSRPASLTDGTDPAGIPAPSRPTASEPRTCPDASPARSCSQGVSQPGTAVSPLSLDETAFTETAKMSDISALMINRAGEDKAGGDSPIFFYSSLWG